MQKYVLTKLDKIEWHKDAQSSMSTTNKRHLQYLSSSMLDLFGHDAVPQTTFGFHQEVMQLLRITIEGQSMSKWCSKSVKFEAFALAFSPHLLMFHIERHLWRTSRALGCWPSPTTSHRIARVSVDAPIIRALGPRSQVMSPSWTSGSALHGSRNSFALCSAYRIRCICSAVTSLMDMTGTCVSDRRRVLYWPKD